MENKFGRRSFLKRAVLISAVGPLFLSRRTGAAPALPMLKATDPMATAFHYCTDAKKATKEMCSLRADAGKKDQFCNGCQFYQPDAANKTIGKCQIIPAAMVNADGWCQSWVKKQS